MAKLSEKIGYGFGDMSSSMFWKIFSYYLPIFYSDVFGLSLVDAGILMLVTRIWDGVSDPMMGIIADRTKTRWGKYRPYLLYLWYSSLHHSRLGICCQARLGVCHIYPYDDGLYGYQRTLWLDAWRDDRRH